MIQPMEAWYSERHVVVIGGLGFIGAHLCRRLAELGARVTAVTRSLARHRDVAEQCGQLGIVLCEADLRDIDSMCDAVSGRDAVFNLAGQSGATQSMEDPWTDLDVNCRGNLALLEAVRRCNPGTRLLFVGSRLSYGRTGALPVAEERMPEPLCVHAVHKLAVEQYLTIYRHVYGLTFTVARLTNPYGPGQPRERTAYGVVNRLIHLALAGEALPIYGDGQQLRDYLFVDDVVTALLQLTASPASAGRTYNVGSGTGTTLVDMAGTIASIAGGGRVELVTWPPLAERIETGDFVADISRIRREIGWEPRVTLSDGLARTVAFYRARAA